MLPETVVVAIITNKDSGETKVLLTQRGTEPFKGKWCLPGGLIRQRESAVDAVARVVKEETGLDFEGRFFDYFSEIIEEYEIHAAVIVFEGIAFEVPKAQKEDVIDVRWFPVKEALSFKLAYNHNEILEAYLTKKMDAGLRTEILQEYSVLKREVIKRTEIRNQLLALTLVAASTFLTMGAQELVVPSVLLIYPILAAFLAAAWTHSDIRVGEIGEYIRRNIESRLEGLGWEAHLRQKSAKRESWLRRRLSEISACGIFLSTEVLAILLAFCHPIWTFSCEASILLFFDILAIIFTNSSIARRRRMYRGKKSLFAFASKNSGT